ncbi:MAG: HAD family phosphatase [Maricaulaceae bacterium]
MTASDSRPGKLTDSRIVLFDLGRVLVDWDPRYLYRKLFDDETAMERFLAEVCTTEWHALHDAGAPMAETAPPLIAAHPHLEEPIRAWQARWDEMFAGPVHGTVEILKRLHAGGRPLYALSNLPAEKRAHIEQTFDFMSLFADVVVSGEEGVRKPDRAIYEIAQARVGAPPDEIVFIDDMEVNVEAGAKFGFDAILYEGPAELAGALAARGLLSES